MRRIIFILILLTGFSLSSLAVSARDFVDLSRPEAVVAMVGEPQGEIRPRDIEVQSSAFSMRESGLLILLLFIATGLITIGVVRYTQRHRRPL